MGRLLAIDFNFTAFQGTLSYDPTDRARCEASLTATVASLVASKANIRDIIVGFDFLDAARFPTFLRRSVRREWARRNAHHAWHHASAQDDPRLGTDRLIAKVFCVALIGA